MNILDSTDVEKLNNIISNLIVGNVIKLGMTIDEAKDAAFNRMAKEEPIIFDLYLTQLTS